MEKRMNLTCYYNTFKLINAGLIAVVPAVTRVRFLTISDRKVCAIFWFSLACMMDKSSGFSPYSLYCFCSSTSYALINFKPPPRLLIDFKNSKGLYLAFYHAFVIVFRMWLAYFPSHDYFSYMFTLLFIHFAYSRDNSQAIFRYTVHVFEFLQVFLFLSKFWYILLRLSPNCAGRVAKTTLW